MSDLKYGAPGPWDDEPDEDDFESCGLACMMWRDTPLGHWCGYVGVRSDHPCFGTHKNELPDLDVHGGLTCSGEGVAGSVGHWWFGFHCGHLGDYAPGGGGAPPNYTAIMIMFAPNANALAVNLLPQPKGSFNDDDDDRDGRNRLFMGRGGDIDGGGVAVESDKSGRSP